MKTIRYIAIRLAFVIAVFAVTAWVYERWFYPSDLASEGWLRQKLDRLHTDRSKVLYLGASTNRGRSEDEADARSITDMMLAEEPRLPIVCYDTGALHAGVFLNVLEWLPEDELPNTVVCELHLRSFSADWLESNLDNSLARNWVYASRSIPLWNRIRVSLKDYPWSPPAERNHRINMHFRFDKLPYTDHRKTVFHWFRHLEKQYQGPPGMAGEYVKKFALVIDEKNERIRQYDRIAAFCKQHHIRLVFVVLGENVQEAESLVGKDIIDLMQRNVDYLVKRYEQRGAEVVNCWNKLPDSVWYERDFITEHYLAEGRKVIAGEIVKQLAWKSGKHKR